MEMPAYDVLVSGVVLYSEREKKSEMISVLAQVNVSRFLDMEV